MAHPDYASSIPLEKGKLVAIVRGDKELEVAAISSNLDTLLYCIHIARPDLEPGSDVIVLEVTDKAEVLGPNKWRIGNRILHPGERLLPL